MNSCSVPFSWVKQLQFMAKTQVWNRWFSNNSCDRRLLADHCRPYQWQLTFLFTPLDWEWTLRTSCCGRMRMARRSFNPIGHFSERDASWLRVALVYNFLTKPDKYYGKNHFTMKKFLFLLLLALATTSGLTSFKELDMTCIAPSRIEITSHTSTSISFAWTGCTNCTSAQYIVWYSKNGEDYTSSQHSTSSTNYTFNNLPAGTYKFYFQTDCGDSVSDVIGTEDIIPGRG